ncbi:uncharacterized protein LOC129586072 isoform X2 [Paramacrobiotus metropolitanus]|uniref:uncharacterized protein LOC129586072 isoform X2 n=1 Tax=Paramacrobiotus metropolitanus TaxID=2943436 RepID=UPI002445A266|nr:uncharacterized protein LOC129586072 isoform X2 [Paramacrobiotus metropolitanus]
MTHNQLDNQYRPKSSPRTLSFAFLLIFCSFLALHEVANGQLPNLLCGKRYLDKGDVIKLWCEDAKLTMPETFNSTSVFPEITSIYITCPNAETRNYCNVMHTNVSALPYRANLFDVQLQGFQSGDDNPIPVGRFLANNKLVIYRLHIKFSRIGRVDRNFLAGFHALRWLHLDDNDIVDVSVDAFASVTPVGGRPVLDDIRLDRNALQRLDWAAFYPLRKSLIGLNHTAIPKGNCFKLYSEQNT